MTVRDARRLTESRRAAAELLADPHASDQDLREAAETFGRNLITVANDEEFWGLLTAASEQVEPATWDRVIAALDLDWAELLPRIGHTPPPPADEVAADFREALAAARAGRRPLAEALNAMRDMGEQLLSVAADPDSTPRRLKQWLRKAIRASAPWVVAVSIGAALSPALVPYAHAAAIHVAATGIPLTPELAHYCLDAFIHLLIEEVVRKARDRYWPEDDGGDG